MQRNRSLLPKMGFSCVSPGAYKSSTIVLQAIPAQKKGVKNPFTQIEMPMEANINMTYVERHMLRVEACAPFAFPRTVVYANTEKSIKSAKPKNAAP